MARGSVRRLLVAAPAAALMVTTLVAPTLGQDASPAPGPASQARVVPLGATIERYSDDLTTTDGWGILDSDEAKVEGEDGGLRFRMLADNWWNTSSHPLGQADPVLRVGVTASLGEGSASAGPMCGSQGDSSAFFLGVVNNGGEWVLGRFVDNQLTIIARDVVAGLNPASGAPVRIELECAVTGAGGDRLALFANGVNVADVTDAMSLGPFDKGGLYASVADTAPFEVLFDDVIILGGPSYQPVVEVVPAPDVSPPASTGPVPGPSCVPSPAPMVGALRSLGADTLVHEEPFDDETAWGVTRGDTGSIAYDEGVLRVTLRPTDNALWSWLPFAASWPVIGIETTVELGSGSGRAGPMCGSAADARFHYATISRAGELSVGTIVEGRLTDVVTFDVPGGRETVRGEPVRVRIECATVGDGTDRVAVLVGDELVGDVVETPSLGPFGKAAILGAGRDRRWSAVFDDMTIRSGDDYAPVGAGGAPSPAPSAAPPTPVPTLAPSPTPSPSPAPIATPVTTPLLPGGLLAAVPETYGEHCRVVPADEATGQAEAVLCAPAGEAFAAEYYRYVSRAQLDASFEAFLAAAGGPPAGTDCSAGPSLVSCTIGGRSAGQLACYPTPDGAGVTLQWSDLDRLTIAFGTLPAASYAEALTWRQTAGPEA